MSPDLLYLRIMRGQYAAIIVCTTGKFEININVPCIPVPWPIIEGSSQVIVSHSIVLITVASYIELKCVTQCPLSDIQGAPSLLPLA